MIQSASLFAPLCAYPMQHARMELGWTKTSHALENPQKTTLHNPMHKEINKVLMSTPITN